MNEMTSGRHTGHGVYSDPSNFVEDPVDVDGLSALMQQVVIEGQEIRQKEQEDQRGEPAVDKKGRDNDGGSRAVAADAPKAPDVAEDTMDMGRRILSMDMFDFGDTELPPPKPVNRVRRVALSKRSYCMARDCTEKPVWRNLPCRHTNLCNGCQEKFLGKIEAGDEIRCPVCYDVVAEYCDTRVFRG